MVSRTISVFAAVAAFTAASAQERTVLREPKGGAGGAVLPEPRYVADPAPDRVKTLLFTTVSPEYVMDRIDFFARSGVGGIMMGHVMVGWESDVWQQPTHHTPGAPAGRVVGEANPLFQLCRRMNERCREAGIRHNSVKVHFSKPLPDWFDDAGWAGLCENFRQGAIFARDAGFAGIALDAEYVAEQYKLTYPAYAAEGYPRERLAAQAARRGHELASAMLSEFPDMVFWVLPEIATVNEWLANQLFAGMVRAFAQRDAVGGFHLCTEETYLQTRPRSMLHSVSRTNRGIAQALERFGGEKALEYWQRRGSIAVGMWPLGYYREVYDESGKLLGYTGKVEKFQGKLVGSSADKSENYSPAEFRRAMAAARLLSRSYVWIYCHGQVLWQMSPQEAQRYRGSESDLLPTVANLDEYLQVMLQRLTLDDPQFAGAATTVREGRSIPPYPGYAPRWWVAGPFPAHPERFDQPMGPESSRNLEREIAASAAGATQPSGIPWREARPDSSGYVDLKALLGKEGTPAAYAAAWVELDTEREVDVRVGTNDFGAVWVNGTQIFSFAQPRPACPDDDAIVVKLPAGRSQILLKCGDAGGAQWGYFLRVCDAAGKAIPEVRWVGPQRAP